MTFGNEKTTKTELTLLKKRLKHAQNYNGDNSGTALIERLEAEISLLEMGITPNTNLERCS